MTEVDLDAPVPRTPDDAAPQRVRRVTVVLTTVALVVGAIAGVGLRAVLSPEGRSTLVARWDVRQAGPSGTQVAVRADLTVWNPADHAVDLTDLSPRRATGSAATVALRVRPATAFPRRVPAGGAVSVEVDAIVDCTTSASDRAGQQVELRSREVADGAIPRRGTEEVTRLSLRGLLRPTTCPGPTRGSGPEEALSTGTTPVGRSLDVLVALPPEEVPRGPREVTGFRLGPEYAGGRLAQAIDATPVAVRLTFVPQWCDGALTSAPTELELVPADAVAGQRILVRVGPELATWWVQQATRICPPRS